MICEYAILRSFPKIAEIGIPSKICKASAGIACLRKISPCKHPHQHKETRSSFNALVRPHLDYCSVVWHACKQQAHAKIELN